MFGVMVKLYGLLSRRHRLQLVGLLAMLTVTALFEMTGTLAIFGFARLAITPDYMQKYEFLHDLYVFTGATSMRDFLIIAGIAVIGLYFVKNGLGLLALWKQDHFAMTIVDEFSVRLMRSYLAQPYEWMVGTNTAILNRNVIVESQQMANFVVLPIFITISDSLVVIGLMTLLFLHDWLATTFVFGLITSVYVVINYPIRRINVRRGRVRMKANEGRFRASQEAFSGFKEIKLFGAENYFINRFGTASKNFTHQVALTRFLSQIPRSTVETIGVLVIFSFILYAVIMGQNPQEFVPSLMLYSVAGFRMLPAFNRISKGIADVEFNKAVLEALYPNLTPGVVYPADRQGLPRLPFDHSIELSNIGFRYATNDTECLNGVSLSIPKNSSAAFVGRTGAGKSTLVELLCGLLVPTAGVIRVDGVQLDASNIDNWQRTIAYVPQHIYLCDDTITRNIAFGVPDGQIDINAVKEAAKLAHLSVFIESELPLGYETVIGERGVRLSGGQRQRLGIARALYLRPDVLILDEATSALDMATEQIISETIAELVGSLTVILIAHRLSTVRDCDRIYVLEQGRVVDSGAYDELLGRNREFRTIAGVA